MSAYLKLKTIFSPSLGLGNEKGVSSSSCGTSRNRYSTYTLEMLTSERKAAPFSASKSETVITMLSAGLKVEPEL
jgi:hypothetical protein